MYRSLANSTVGPARRYKMTADPRGKCLIFNNKTFASVSLLPERRGTDSDKEKLQAMFRSLKFEVRCENDVSDTDMLGIITRAAQEDHTRYDCFVCCILSHGAKGAVYGSNGVPIKIRKLTERLCPQSCPSLCGKPKFFIIQACQGDRVQRGHPEIQADSEMDEEELIPEKADFLLAYSTVPGCKSFRVVNEGTYFIQTLVEALYKHAHEFDILAILTYVNGAIGSHNIYPDGEEVPQKQSPAQFHSLRKLLYLSSTPLCSGPHPPSDDVASNAVWIVDDASRTQQQSPMAGASQSRVLSAYGKGGCPQQPFPQAASIQAASSFSASSSPRAQAQAQDQEIKDDMTLAFTLQLLERMGLGKYNDLLCGYSAEELQRMSADELKKLGLPKEAQVSLRSSLRQISSSKSLRNTSPVSSCDRLSTSLPFSPHGRSDKQSASQGDRRRLSGSAYYPRSSSGASSTQSIDRQHSLPASLPARNTRDDSVKKPSTGSVHQNRNA